MKKLLTLLALITLSGCSSFISPNKDCLFHVESQTEGHTDKMCREIEIVSLFGLFPGAYCENKKITFEDKATKITQKCVETEKSKDD